MSLGTGRLHRSHDSSTVAHHLLVGEPPQVPAGIAKVVGTPVVGGSLLSGRVTPMSVELEPKCEVDVCGIDERTTAVRQNHRVLEHRRREAGGVQETSEGTLQYRVRDRERTSVEHDRHRPDTITALSSNLPMAIGDDSPISEGIALGPVERVLDALEAA